MNPRSRLTAAALLLLALSSAAAEKPNIVLIMSDDMGWSDIGCYGGEISTPNLDALAKGGVRFTQFYNTGRCCPTRASLLTGLYPHQAGIGHMTGDYGLPSYRGDLNRECVTIAEALRPAGYRTYMAGKWHVTPYRGGKDEVADPDTSNWPLQRGFDRFYGTIHGAGSFFDPNSLTRDNTYITPENDPEYDPPGTWYYTDAISDNTVRHIRDHAEHHPGKPFFHYVAYTAAHWPMHALPGDIAPYEGKYAGGYAPARRARLEKLRKMKLLPDHWEPAPLVGDWDGVELKEWEAACMEVYAAMVHNMDRGIGRIVEALEETGQLENTLILFLQDNGGCAETFGRNESVGPVKRPDEPTLPPMGRDQLQTEMVPPQSRDGYPLRRGPGVMPGPDPETEIGYGRNWANVSNTPFREYKHYVHEGGISTPLIAHWPAGISREGAAFRGTAEGNLHDGPSHLIDVMATALDIAGADYPAEHGGSRVKPAEGISLAPAFDGKPLDRGNPIFFEHEGNRAVRDGRWKLVAKGVDSPWELYDMEADRTETNDLAARKPDLAARMAAQYEAWATRAGVVPFNSWKKDEEKGSKEKSFRLEPGDSLPGGNSPSVAKRNFEVTARVTGLPAEGVIASQGGSNRGWSLFVKDGEIAFATRNGKTVNLVSAPLPGGDASEFQAKVMKGKLLLRAGGKQIGSTECQPQLTGHPQDGVEIGRDLGGTVADYGKVFGGTIEEVLVEVK